MISSNASDAQIAFHEAGHCVAAYLTGIFLMKGVDHTAGASHAHAEFELDSMCQQMRAHDLQPGLTEADYKRERAVISAAGVAAERRYLEFHGMHVDEQQLSLGARGDLEGVVALLGPGHWDRAEAAATKLMDEPAIWSAVASLASAIRLKQGKLSGDQVTHVIENALNPSDVELVRVLRY
ncbi:hypothetical protein [Variovorax atrisoli]|uniref:hypothetical protein n=1 Tax=Variovorax atrisoli TaxID=3394203 RepID=UPI00339084DE